jgi:Protein of unknown function (DUF5818)
MRKLSLIAAVLLLSSAWVLAQSSAPNSSQYPSSTAPSAQQPAQQPDASQTATGDHSVEGCIGGSAGNFTLTDASGKTYQLAGDTSKLGDHVGHQVRITGSEEAAAPGAAAAAGAPTTLTVKKVKMISSSCPTK